MTVPLLPRSCERTLVPPVKCQGIKTKLVPFIMSSIRWTGDGRWVEPFLGSGVVALNVQPQRAMLNDSNPHIINLYRAIYSGEVTPARVRAYLKQEGAKLLDDGGDYYYAVRERFNAAGNPLDFLFLNRSCFNGLVRFNKKGQFNVPFCRKPDRFRQAYVTKIVNQVKAIQDVMQNTDWEFRVGDWRDVLHDLDGTDFVYLDPPYIGRHADYYNQWDDEDAAALAEVAQALPGGVALSMWKSNKYRENDYLEQWPGMVERTVNHFYHLGPTEALRNAMQEALLVKPGYEAPLTEDAPVARIEQLTLPFSE